MVSLSVCVFGSGVYMSLSLYIITVQCVRSYSLLRYDSYTKHTVDKCVQTDEAHCVIYSFRILVLQLRGSCVHIQYEQAHKAFR